MIIIIKSKNLIKKERKATPIMTLDFYAKLINQWRLKRIDKILFLKKLNGHV